MLRALKHAWTEFQARNEARRRAKVRAFAAAVVRDCYDPARQAERLARWDALLSH
jgi:hypothetical protein